DGGETERCVQRDLFVRNGDEPERLVAARAGLGDRFLVEGDLRSGDEEQMIDAAGGHRGHHRVGIFLTRRFGPAVESASGLTGPGDLRLLVHTRSPAPAPVAGDGHASSWKGATVDFLCGRRQPWPEPAASPRAYVPRL